MDEFAIIARYFAPIAGPGGLGLQDDAAKIKPPAGHDLIITTDALVADVHFFADDPADSLARKALGVNLSDLAAKGADPLGFVLSLMMPADLPESWIAAFAASLGLASQAAKCPLLGGDTVVTPGPLSLSLTLFGSVPEGRMVRRGGARTGDRLYVTGSIGDGAIGLQARLAERTGKPWPLTVDHREFLRNRYLVPRPRGAIAAALRSHAHAGMDVSDGFVGDLSTMLHLAGLGADIQLADVPHSVAARAAIQHDPSLQDVALTGGDDYEVLAAVPADRSAAFQAECLATGVQVTEVGRVLSESAPIRFLDAQGKPKSFGKGSYVHGVAGPPKISVV